MLLALFCEIFELYKVVFNYGYLSRGFRKIVLFIFASGYDPYPPRNRRPVSPSGGMLPETAERPPRKSENKKISEIFDKTLDKRHFLVYNIDEKQGGKQNV